VREGNELIANLFGATATVIVIVTVCVAGAKGWWSWW